MGSKLPRFLNALVEVGEVRHWEYESDRFDFPLGGDGPDSYLPDFQVWLPGGGYEWHEVKGWMTESGAAALRLMGEHYSNEVVVLRDENWFRAAKRSGLADSISGWE